MDFSYRKAELKDIDEVMIAVEDARTLLKEQGNGQWQDGYPDRNSFINDIHNQRLFVVLDKKNNEKIVGCCALTYFEEDYSHLYEGEWKTDLPYMVMHRVAVKKDYRGLGYGKLLFKIFDIEAVKEGYHSLRIDTHENNGIMRHLIEQAGYIYCGKAILKPNKDRVVYEKIIEGEN